MAEALDLRQAELVGEPPNGRKQFGAAQRQGRLGVAEEIFQFPERIGRVQRQQRRSSTKAGERQHDPVRRLVDLRRDPISGLDAKGDKRVGRLPCPLDQPGIGQPKGVARLERRLAGLAGGAGGDEIEQVGGGLRQWGPLDVRPAPGANAHTLLAEAVRPRDSHTAHD